ncbi:golgin subfamily B member 1-like [Protopterus annectens]|uniref:golgin subfamily B member 1-like n=1 Tax=Protopterus annectens TaxID=7888 RepID=UPI001CFC2403|nr:golgin subfamily B member 1-like [Protopterus annectens]
MAEHKKAGKIRRLGASRRLRRLQKDSKEDEETDSLCPPDILERVHEFFQKCDADEKGFITRIDMQKLQENFPFSTEELEMVFDKLDKQGHGYVTNEDFIAGLKEFLTAMPPKPGYSKAKRARENVFTSPRFIALEEADDEEQQNFKTLMDRLGADNIFEDQSEIWKLWTKLRQDEPHLLGNLEEFLSKVTQQIRKTKEEKDTLEMTLKKRITEHNTEVHQLYEEMEEQITREKERLHNESYMKSNVYSKELKKKLDVKNDEVQHLLEVQTELEKQLYVLQNKEHATVTENEELKRTNRELETNLEGIGHQLQEAQERLKILRSEAAQQHVDQQQQTPITQGREKDVTESSLQFINPEEMSHYSTTPEERRKQAIATELSFHSEGPMLGDYFSDTLLSSHPFLISGDANSSHRHRIISIEEDPLPEFIRGYNDNQPEAPVEKHLEQEGTSEVEVTQHETSGQEMLDHEIQEKELQANYEQDTPSEEVLLEKIDDYNVLSEEATSIRLLDDHDVISEEFHGATLLPDKNNTHELVLNDIRKGILEDEDTKLNDKGMLGMNLLNQDVTSFDKEGSLDSISKDTAPEQELLEKISSHEISPESFTEHRMLGEGIPSPGVHKGKSSSNEFSSHERQATVSVDNEPFSVVLSEYEEPPQNTQNTEVFSNQKNKYQGILEGHTQKSPSVNDEVTETITNVEKIHKDENVHEDAPEKNSDNQEIHQDGNKQYGVTDETSVNQEIQMFSDTQEKHKDGQVEEGFSENIPDRQEMHQDKKVHEDLKEKMSDIQEIHLTGKIHEKHIEEMSSSQTIPEQEEIHEEIKDNISDSQFINQDEKVPEGPIEKISDIQEIHQDGKEYEGIIDYDNQAIQEFSDTQDIHKDGIVHEEAIKSFSDSQEIHQNGAMHERPASKISDSQVHEFSYSQEVNQDGKSHEEIKTKMHEVVIQKVTVSEEICTSGDVHEELTENISDDQNLQEVVTNQNIQQHGNILKGIFGKKSDREEVREDGKTNEQEINKIHERQEICEDGDEHKAKLWNISDSVDTNKDISEVKQVLEIVSTSGSLPSKHDKEGKVEAISEMNKDYDVRDIPETTVEQEVLLETASTQTVIKESPFQEHLLDESINKKIIMEDASAQEVHSDQLPKEDAKLQESNKHDTLLNEVPSPETSYEVDSILKTPALDILPEEVNRTELVMEEIPREEMPPEKPAYQEVPADELSDQMLQQENIIKGEMHTENISDEDTMVKIQTEPLNVKTAVPEKPALQDFITKAEVLETANGTKTEETYRTLGQEAVDAEKDTKQNPDYVYHLVFVGNSNAGKTTFLCRVHENIFFAGLATTVGVDYRIKTLIVDDKLFALQLWDTAGQERFHSITRQCFRKADGVVVMYDITSVTSFTAVRNWISSAQDGASEDVPILLLGNKLDMSQKRDVPFASGEHLAKEYNLPFYECSALSGENVIEPLIHFARVLKEHEKIMKEKAVTLEEQPQEKEEKKKKSGCCS